MKRGKVTPAEIGQTLAVWKPCDQSAFWLISGDLNIRRRHENTSHSSQNGIWYDCCALELGDLYEMLSGETSFFIKFTGANDAVAAVSRVNFKIPSMVFYVDGVATNLFGTEGSLKPCRQFISADEVIKGVRPWRGAFEEVDFDFE
ncbi:hypothetical protein FS815_17160 [Agrobacterium vitis]|uniref:hypothetical protein n=1 Tax=Allorhizobium ampelinum TaxID=3025782 RepID=UPI001F27E919|nr:hypothetical protein [Allorhizobium ampelinum]MCF1448550.1 hypothetical protein [Allorhizobium ampelinum]